jgi:Zn-dependent alcohol dehydrogenase
MINMVRRIDGFRKAAIIVVLILAVIAPGLAAKERKGAKIIVTKLDKQVLRGELLSVKGEEFTVLDLSTASRVTMNLREVKDIEIGRRSTFATAAILGALAFGVPAVIYGAENENASPVLLGCGGAVGGALTGAILAGMSKFMFVDVNDPESLAKISARLRRRARDRD